MATTRQAGHSGQTAALSRSADRCRNGWRLWAEACRRSVTASTEVVIIDDGARWIWSLADEHFSVLQDGRVTDVLTEPERYRARGRGMADSLSPFTTH